MNQDFPQMQDLLLTRENHKGVLDELRKMQQDSTYESTLTPAKELKDSIPLSADESRSVAPRVRQH